VAGQANIKNSQKLKAIGIQTGSSDHRDSPQNTSVYAGCGGFAGTTSYAIVNLLSIASLDSAGTLPKQLAALLAQSRHFVLPPRRSGRSFPRVVKKRASKFPTKKCQSVA
jgi:hypothetical protein